MPTLASVSVRYSRKYQIRKDDWIGLEALITLAVSDAEAAQVDPQSVTAEAFALAKAAVSEQRDAIHRALQAAQDAAAQRLAAEAAGCAPYDDRAAPSAAPVAAPPPVVSPRTAQEAEQRFFTRYGAIIGGTTWPAAQRYLRTRAPKPMTLHEWYAAAQAVRDRARTATSVGAAHNGAGK